MNTERKWMPSTFFIFRVDFHGQLTYFRLSILRCTARSIFGVEVCSGTSEREPPSNIL
jgi:hypothetical protein